LLLSQNNFDTSDIRSFYASDAVLIDSRDFSDLGLGKYTADVKFESSGSQNIIGYIKSADFGLYAEDGASVDEYGAIMITGEIDFEILYDMIL